VSWTAAVDPDALRPAGPGWHTRTAGVLQEL
jgi:hypothetical protein